LCDTNGAPQKAAANFNSDTFALTREDPQTAGEQRFVTLGLSDTGNLLVVVYTHREPDAFRVISAWKATAGKGLSMKKTDPEPYRDIDFSQAKRGAVVKPEPGKTKISIRLDNSVIEAFRALADEAGGGNYQTLINDALVAYLHQHTVLEAVRQVVREEMGAAKATPRRSKSRRVASQATP
jgi:uncharacterized protein (DUF4415 family)